MTRALACNMTTGRRTLCHRDTGDMDERTIVAYLYVIGAVVTASGVLIAYAQAVRQKGRLDELADLNAADDEPDFTEDFHAVVAGDDDAVASRAAARASRQAELEQMLNAAGIDDPAPTWNDMRLPVAYWSKRSALADTVASFKTGGLVALTGLALSTVASVWSLYV